MYMACSKRNDERIIVCQITASSLPPVRPIAKYLFVGMAMIVVATSDTPEPKPYMYQKAKCYNTR